MSTLKINTAAVFEPLLQPSRYKGAHGGRGSGKSHFFGELTIEEHLLYPGLRTMCIREVQKSLKESMKLLLQDKIKKLGVEGYFNVRANDIQKPGDGVIVFQGMQDHNADSVKSFENFNRSLCEEAQVLSTRSNELLRPTIRNAGPAPMAERRYIWNPRNASDPVDLLLRGIEPPADSIVVQANYTDNPWFPDDMEAERAFDLINNPDRYGHIWLGGYEPQAIGAIWTRLVLHQNRLPALPVPPVERIVVGVDPAVSNTSTSNEHGIAVCAVDSQNQGYLLEDASTSGSPHKWATRAVAMFDKWEADAVVIEINQGGDMCKHTLQTIRKSLPIIEVRATRGKHVRAEPISALYTTNQIHHVGTFPELEDQLCLFTASGWEGDDDKSPDRAEAAIWCFTHLFPALTAGREEKAEEEDRATEGGWMG